MPPYSALFFALFFLLAFFLIWTIDRDKYASQIPTVALGVLLILFLGLRFEVGRDYPIYKDAFENVFSSHSQHMSRIWKTYNEVLRFLHLDFSVWTLGVAALFIPLTLWGYKKQSYRFAIAALTFILVWKLYFESFNTVRQCMAQAICLFSIPLFRDRRYLETLIVLLLAYLTHSSAIIMFVLVPLFFVRFNRVFMGILFALSLTLLPIITKAILQFSIPYLPFDTMYIEQMYDTQEGLGSGIMYYFNTLIAFYFLWRQKDLLDRDRNLLPYINTFFFATIITNTFVFFQVADRFMYFPFFFLPILISNLYEKGNLYDRWVIITLLVVQSLITMRNIMNTDESYYNYKIIIHDREAPNDFWINQTNNRTYSLSLFRENDQPNEPKGNEEKRREQICFGLFPCQAQ